MPTFYKGGIAVDDEKDGKFHATYFGNGEKYAEGDGETPAQAMANALIAAAGRLTSCPLESKEPIECPCCHGHDTILYDGYEIVCFTCKAMTGIVS